jgi:hypothetical protein
MILKDASSPTGGAWAAILSAAIGCAAFGVATDLAETSKPISKFLNFYSPTGDLSGKSTVGIVTWLLAWAILHVLWNGRNIQRTGTIAVISVIFLLLGLISIFPPFMEMITGH